MPAVFFIGDPHFFHESVAHRRGFDSAEQMNAHIIKRLCKQLREDSRVIWMGDLSGGGITDEARALEVIAELPGHHELISGNHDSTSAGRSTPSPNMALFREVFTRISDLGMLRIEKQNVSLSHYPFASQGDGPGRGSARLLELRVADVGQWLIHAHTHHTHPTSGSVTRREICVSWDAWGRAVDLGDIHKLMFPKTSR